jgi:hypothetical protein
MEFGSVEKTVKGLLVLFVQTFAKLPPPAMLLFHNETERHNRSAHAASRRLRNKLRRPFIELQGSLNNTHHMMSCQANS